MAQKKKSKKLPPISKTIPQESTKELFVRQQRLDAQTFSGPLPPPEILGGYDEVVPGAAERILAMAENQARHRQDLEKLAIKAGTRDSLLGLIFGLIIGLAAIIGGIFSIYIGQEIEGTIISGTAIVSLVGVFIYGSRSKRLEREEKNKMMQQ